MSGPRDWLPSSGVNENGRAIRRRRRGGSFLRAVLTSILVVPVGILAWMFLWQFGLVSSIVGWLVALLAVALFRWGSGGPVSNRGVVTLAIVISSTVVAGLASAYLFDVARQFSPEAAVPLGVVADTVGDVAYWSSVRDGLDSQRSDAIWLMVSGLVLAVGGFVPTLVAAAGGRSRIVAIVLPLACLAVVVGVTFARQSPTAPPQAEIPVSQYGVAAGDCIDSVSEPDGVIGEEQTGIPLVSCTDPHWGEVVYIGSTPGREGSSGYPGGPWLSLEAQVQCRDAFAQYVGVPMETSVLARQLFFPGESSWESGIRDLVCAVYDPAAQTVGTLRNSAR